MTYLDAEPEEPVPASQWAFEAPYVDNVAEHIEDLDKIGLKVLRDFDIDERSRSQWDEDRKEWQDLANQNRKDKTFPWSGASNIIFPLITKASKKFAERAYEAIVPDGNVVKAKVVGEDPEGGKEQRAERVSAHMSYQLLDEMTEWADETDKLLHILPTDGCCFRKVYHDSVLNRPVSELVTADRLYVNQWAKCLKTAPRITHLIEYYPNEIREKELAGEFLENDYGRAEDSEDDDAPHEFLEQHRLMDLDEDGYGEPYIVTVHKQTGKVARIVANWDVNDLIVDAQSQQVLKIPAREYFVKFDFLPAPDGSFYGVGFGWLLKDLNRTINTLVNQLIDAGTLSNAGGGFVGRGAGLKGGTVRIKPGVWQFVETKGQNLRESFVPYPMNEPSLVLFQTLGLLIDIAEDLSDSTPVLGDGAVANMPATTAMALVEQGMKGFTATYKRIHRSLKDEFRLLFKCNQLYLPEQAYFMVLDTPQAVQKADYATEDMDIVPVSDPAEVSNIQKSFKAQFIMGLAESGMADPMEASKRAMEYMRIEDAEALLPKPQQGPDPLLLIAEAEINMKAMEVEAKVEKIRAEIFETYTDAIKNMAEAEAADKRLELEENMRRFDQIIQVVQQAREENDRRRLSSMAQQAGNAGGAAGGAGAGGRGQPDIDQLLRSAPGPSPAFAGPVA